MLLGGICNNDDHDKMVRGNWAEIEINIFYFGLLAIIAMGLIHIRVVGRDM